MSMIIASTGRDLSRWMEALQKEGRKLLHTVSRRIGY